MFNRGNIRVTGIIIGTKGFFDTVGYHVLDERTLTVGRYTKHEFIETFNNSELANCKVKDFNIEFTECEIQDIPKIGTHTPIIYDSSLSIIGKISSKDGTETLYRVCNALGKVKEIEFRRLRNLDGSFNKKSDIEISNARLVSNSHYVLKRKKPIKVLPLRNKDIQVHGFEHIVYTYNSDIKHILKVYINYNNSLVIDILKEMKLEVTNTSDSMVCALYEQAGDYDRIINIMERIASRFNTDNAIFTINFYNDGIIVKGKRDRYTITYDFDKSVLARYGYMNMMSYITHVYDTILKGSKLKTNINYN